MPSLQGVVGWGMCNSIRVWRGRGGGMSGKSGARHARVHTLSKRTYDKVGKKPRRHVHLSVRARYCKAGVEQAHELWG